MTLGMDEVSAQCGYLIALNVGGLWHTLLLVPLLLRLLPAWRPVFRSRRRLRRVKSSHSATPATRLGPWLFAPASAASTTCSAMAARCAIRLASARPASNG